MKSIKRKNGANIPLGIVLFIIGIVFVSASALQENSEKANITHIGDDAGSVTIVTNINWLQIGLFIVGFLIMALDLLRLTIYFLFKDDFINVESETITCRGNLRNYTIPLEEIEYCKSSNFNIKLKRKNDEKPITIRFIDNAHAISTLIESEIQKYSKN